jgi:hypothetical protein
MGMKTATGLISYTRDCKCGEEWLLMPIGRNYDDDDMNIFKWWAR